MKRLVVLFCVATLLVLSLALPALAASKFERQCSALNGLIEEGTKNSPKDDYCYYATRGSMVNSAGNTLYYEDITYLYPDGTTELELRDYYRCVTPDGVQLFPSTDPGCVPS